MFVGILLRDLVRDFRVVFRALAPSRVLRNQFARGKKKTIGIHLKVIPLKQKLQLIFVQTLSTKCLSYGNSLWSSNALKMPHHKNAFSVIVKSLCRAQTNISSLIPKATSLIEDLNQIS